MTPSSISTAGVFFLKPRFVYIRDLLVTLVAREMKVRYKRSILGIAWSLLTPLAQLSVFYLIWNVLLPLNIPNYLPFLFCGMLVWAWFQGALYQATAAIVDNRELIKHPGFPIAVLPMVTVASHLIQFLLALPILLFIIVVDGNRLTSAVLGLPLVIALQFFLILSLAYFTATFHVTFRDTQHLVGVLLNLFFFLTPVFYDAQAIPAQYQAFYRLNPMMHVIEAYRAILLTGTLPDPSVLLILSAVTIGILLLSYYVFTRASYRFADEL
jgi:lipopolysaccharide transport system permease protein